MQGYVDSAFSQLAVLADTANAVAQNPGMMEAADKVAEKVTRVVVHSCTPQIVALLRVMLVLAPLGVSGCLTRRALLDVLLFAGAFRV